MNELDNYPRPWRVTTTRKQRRTGGGYHYHIRAANDNYVVENVHGGIACATVIVEGVNEREERDQLRSALAEAEAQLAIVTGLNEWHDAPELPTHVGHYLAFWAEDGAWVAQYWPSGIEDENGNKGNWLTTPDGAIRPNPVAWRHLPSVPDRYVVQAEYFQR